MNNKSLVFLCLVYVRLVLSQSLLTHTVQSLQSLLTYTVQSLQSLPTPTVQSFHIVQTYTVLSLLQNYKLQSLVILAIL